MPVKEEFILNISIRQILDIGFSKKIRRKFILRTLLTSYGYWILCAALFGFRLTLLNHLNSGHLLDTCKRKIYFKYLHYTKLILDSAKNLEEKLFYVLCRLLVGT